MRRGKALFELLRRLRLTIARESDKAAYMIFYDSTLIEMAVKRPRNREELLNISGIGAYKLEKYGDQFLNVIRCFEKNNQNQPAFSDGIDSDTEKQVPLTEVSQVEAGSDGAPVTTELDSIPITKELVGNPVSVGSVSLHAAARSAGIPDADRPVYQKKCDDGNYYVSDIHGLMNNERLRHGMEQVKLSAVIRFLNDQGLIETNEVNGKKKKRPTEKGREAGILVVDRPGKTGRIYGYVEYPESIYLMVVKHFAAS